MPVPETWVRSLGQEDHLEEEVANCSSNLAGKFHGQRSLVGYSPWGCKEKYTTAHMQDELAGPALEEELRWGPEPRTLQFGLLRSVLWLVIPASECFHDGGLTFLAWMALEPCLLRDEGSWAETWRGRDRGRQDGGGRVAASERDGAGGD